MYLIFDTETTGLPKIYTASVSDTDNWPRCIQIAWQLHDDMGKLIEHQDYLIKPDGFNIPYDAEKIHGISTELAEAEGISLSEVIEKFNIAISKTKFIVGHNVGFDINIMSCEFYRLGFESSMASMPILDTCTEVTASLLRLLGGRGGKFKLPTLTELHNYLFNKPFSELHNATADVEATTRCFFELIRTGVFTKTNLEVKQEYFENFRLINPRVIQVIGLQHINLRELSITKKKKITDSPNYAKGKFMNDDEFRVLIGQACQIMSNKKFKSENYMFISGFKMTKNHKGNNCFMMQLVQIRETEFKDDPDYCDPVFFGDKIPRRKLKVWKKINIENFEKLFGDVDGKINIREIFNLLIDNSKEIYAIFVPLKTIFINGISEIPTLEINQISNKKNIPQNILEAIDRVNYILSDNIYDKNDWDGFKKFRATEPHKSDIEFEIYYKELKESMYLYVNSQKELYDSYDEILIRQFILRSNAYSRIFERSPHGTSIFDSRKYQIFEIINLTYGKPNDIIIENKVSFNTYDNYNYD